MNVVREHEFCDDPLLTDADRQILDVYGQLYGQTSNTDEYLLKLKDDFIIPKNRCFTLTHEGDISGVANYASVPRNKESFLQGIVIEKTKRRMGLGALLLDHLMEVTEQDGNEFLSLESYDSAVDFYLSQGFVITSDDDSGMPEMAKYVL